MSVMGRWYGREVVFENEADRRITFSGNFDRYEDIVPTMDAISSVTGLRIQIKKDKIILTNK